MGKQIDKIKQQERMTPQEILAGLIWDRAVNSIDRIFKVPYYRFPCYIEYCHEHEGDGFTLDCLYLGQEHSFMLVQPKYKEIVGIAQNILEWLDATYAMYCPPEPPRPRRGRRNRVANNRSMMGPSGNNQQGIMQKRGA